MHGVMSTIGKVPTAMAQLSCYCDEVYFPDCGRLCVSPRQHIRSCTYRHYYTFIIIISISMYTLLHCKYTLLYN